MSSQAIINARLLDTASDYDGPGSVVIEDGVITRVERGSVAVSACVLVVASRLLIGLTLQLDLLLISFGKAFEQFYGQVLRVVDELLHRHGSSPLD